MGSRCHKCQVSSLHWALSGWPVDWAPELLEVIEGHSVLLRPASEAAQLGGRPEAVSEVSGLSPVTSKSKHGQTRERRVSYFTKLQLIRIPRGQVRSGELDLEV